MYYSRWSTYIVPACILAAALITWWLFGASGYDDPYITYRYAANIAMGNGFVYNSGERVLSTTTPLYALLLGVVSWLGGDIPQISNAIGCASLALGGLALWHLGQTWRTLYIGSIAGIVYTVFPQLVMTLGSEATFGLGLALAGFAAGAAGRYHWAALLLALATLTRADALIAVGVLVGYGIWRVWQVGMGPRGTVAAPGRRGAVAAPGRPVVAMFIIPLATWGVWAWFYFGWPLPVTLTAKRLQAQMAISPGFLAELWRVLTEDYGIIYAPHAVLALFGLGYGLARARPWLLIPLWSTLYGMAYTLLGVSGYFWYYAALVPGAAVLCALGIVAISSVLPSTRRLLVSLAPYLLVCALLAPQIYSLIGMSRLPNTRMALYQSTGEWLRTNTAPNARVGALEVGIIGYYAERPMIDYAGLLQPATARQFRREATYDDTAIWATQTYQPEYVLLIQGQLPRFAAWPPLREHCRVVHTVRATAAPQPLDVYRCAWR